MKRLDQALVDLALIGSREKAKRAIIAGQVLVNGQVAKKASDSVKESDSVSLVAPEKYVSRGGHKLEHALTHFQLSVTGLRAIDVGASTGGFTDCLLQHGAAFVAAVDVGQAQLAWKLRNDPRVLVMEQRNARELTPSHFPAPFEPFDLAVIDCSFISLRKVLGPVLPLLKSNARVVALIKPQFEAGKAEADKGGGVIRDPEIHSRVIAELKEFVADLKTIRWLGDVPSPLLGPAGNKEFLALLAKTE
jgi:23S rRNA (cytidine1920-2'-O)/16S rRNA (cytidine1409-2'-O)-methyltransferase